MRKATKYHQPRALRRLTSALSDALDLPEADVVRLAVEELSIRLDDYRVSDGWYAYCRLMREEHGIEPGEQDAEGRQGLERVLARRRLSASAGAP